MTNGNKEVSKCSIGKLKNLMHQSRIVKLLDEMTSLRLTDTRTEKKVSLKNVPTKGLNQNKKG